MKSQQMTLIFASTGYEEFLTMLMPSKEHLLMNQERTSSENDEKELSYRQSVSEKEFFSAQKKEVR